MFVCCLLTRAGRVICFGRAHGLGIRFAHRAQTGLHAGTEGGGLVSANPQINHCFQYPALMRCCNRIRRALRQLEVMCFVICALNRDLVRVWSNLIRGLS